jgi:hypothetical protein
MDEIHPFMIAWMYEFHSSLMDRCHLSIHSAHEPINHEYILKLMNVIQCMDKDKCMVLINIDLLSAAHSESARQKDNLIKGASQCAAQMRSHFSSPS